MGKSKSINSVFLIILVYIFVFQNWIEQYISVFTYFDEFYAMICLFGLLVYLANNFREPYLRKYQICLSVILICQILVGIISSQNISRPIANIFSDSIINSKFLLSFIATSFLFKGIDSEKLSSALTIHIKIIVTTLFSMFALDYMFNIFPHNYERFGFRCFQLFYQHPSRLASAGIFLLVLMLMIESSGEKLNIYKAATVILIISTFRSKAIGLIVIYFAVDFYTNKLNKKIKLRQLLVFVPIILPLVYPQIQDYYIENKNASRLQLTLKSISIANDYFPFGSGYSTYGSAPSIDPYSVVYSKYRLSNIWGLSKAFPQDLSDTFWPMILGQFGYIGLILKIIEMIIFVKIINVIRKGDRRNYFAAVILFVYLVIASTSESAFVSPYATSYALLFSISLQLYIKYINNNKGNESSEHK